MSISLLWSFFVWFFLNKIFLVPHIPTAWSQNKCQFWQLDIRFWRLKGLKMRFSELDWKLLSANPAAIFLWLAGIGYEKSTFFCSFNVGCNTKEVENIALSSFCLYNNSSGRTVAAQADPQVVRLMELSDGSSYPKTVMDWNSLPQETSYLRGKVQDKPCVT